MNEYTDPRFSIATNVCEGDDAIIRFTIPSWLRVFGKRLFEILIVVDEEPRSGRLMLANRALNAKESLHSELLKLTKLDPRIRPVALPEVDKLKINDIHRRWFIGNKFSNWPIRCQGGTPIFALIYGIEESKGDVVLRTDCDILFYDNGWAEKAMELLSSDLQDLVEPCRLDQLLIVSTRAFMLSKFKFKAKCLPMKPHHLDLLRRIHRRLKGRTTWLALEQIFTKEKEAGRIKHSILDSSLGFSIHIDNRDDSKLDRFASFVAKIEAGEIPLHSG